MRTSIVVESIGPYQHAPQVQHTDSIPTANENQVLVRVLSSGLAFPDILQIEDKHIEKRVVPFIVGREISGIAIAVGRQVCEVSVGDRVFGATLDGALTTHAILESSNIYKFSEKVNPHVAAGFEVNYGTSYHALHDVAKLQQGETLLVLGASGGVGLAAVDIGKAMGATVIACASSQVKLNVCQQAGAHHLIQYNDPIAMRKEIERITGGKPMGPNGVGGVDVVYDAVGGPWSEAAIRCLRWKGRHLVIGFASGAANPKTAIPSIPLNLALLNERQILGVLWGHWRSVNNSAQNRSNIYKMIEWIEQGKLNPIVSKVYPMVEGYKQAMDDMMNRKVIGKICLEPPQSGQAASKL